MERLGRDSHDQALMPPLASQVFLVTEVILAKEPQANITQFQGYWTLTILLLPAQTETNAG